MICGKFKSSLFSPDTSSAMAAESRSLLERISGRISGAQPSYASQRSTTLPLSPEGDFSPQPPSCAQELILTDSEEGTPPKILPQKSQQAKKAEPKCSYTSNLSSVVQEKPRICVVVTDSSDEEFEKFLTQLKTPKASSNKALEKKSNSLKEFIVYSDDDEFDSVFSKKGTTSKAKNELKTNNRGHEGPQRTTPSMRWDSPVFISDSDEDSIVIKSTWRDRHRTNPDIKTNNGHTSSSIKTNRKENTPDVDKLERPKTESLPAENLFCTPVSSDDEFERLMDRIKNRTKNQTPGSTASKIKPKTAATEPSKMPCFDLTNTEARKPQSQTDLCSSPYFSKDKALKDPVHCVEKTTSEKMRRLCKVEGCFLQELSCSSSMYVKNFKQKKLELTTRLYSLYNQTIFEQKLPGNLEITWNKKMRKTAGYCVTGQKRQTLERYARIELSEKVCDSADRLRDTLIHEICHAATWLINGVRDGHGQYWKFYARKATLVHPELPMVSRCHSYEINYKFTYECSRCKNTIGRHSKSLDTEKFVCALCKGKLVLQTNSRKDGSPSVNQLTPFAKFVKENYGSTKKEMLGMSHAEVMRKLSADFSSKTNISN
ncbi:germ cell nuclear acidic protein-like isoform X2 [Engystomops pustulosus]|uniref:germ cell nuclear acidic protein-like isoform X2 n=1 Tax=Engystomops pustulosus TaxID=76066 RepID=UPI003AFA669C